MVLFSDPSIITPHDLDNRSVYEYDTIMSDSVLELERDIRISHDIGLPHHYKFFENTDINRKKVNFLSTIFSNQGFNVEFGLSELTGKLWLKIGWR